MTESVAQSMGLQAVPQYVPEPPIPEGMEGNPIPAAKAGNQTENLLPDDQPQQMGINPHPRVDGMVDSKQEVVTKAVEKVTQNLQPNPSPVEATSPPTEKVSDCSPASVDSATNKEFDEYCVQMKQYANHGYVSLHIAQMGNNPMVLPPILLWNIPDAMAFVDGVLGMFRDRNFLGAAYPLLKVLMTDNIQNWQWSASVTITLAVFAKLASLGEVRHEGDELPEVQEAKEDNR